MRIGGGARSLMPSPVASSWEAKHEGNDRTFMLWRRTNRTHWGPSRNRRTLSGSRAVSQLV
jgi:hypothetical protein